MATIAAQPHEISRSSSSEDFPSNPAGEPMANSPSANNNNLNMSTASNHASLSYILENEPENQNQGSLNYTNLKFQKQQMQNLNKRLKNYIEDSNRVEEEIDWLNQENERLRAQLRPEANAELEQFVDNYEDQFSVLRREIRELSGECNALEHEKQNTKTETDMIKNKINSLENDREILNASIRDAFDETQLVNSEYQKLSEEIEQLKHDIAAEEKRYANEKNLLESRLASITPRGNNNEIPAEEFRAKPSDNIIRQIKEAREEIRQATNKFHESELDQLNHQIRKYRENILEKEKKQKALDKEIDDLENKKHILEADVQSLEAKIRALEISINEMKQQHSNKISRLQEKMDREQQQLEQAKGELEQIQHQLETHLNDKQSLNEELDEMKRLLGINENDDLSSIIETFSREPSIRNRVRSGSSSSSKKSNGKKDGISLDPSLRSRVLPSRNPSERLVEENQAARPASASSSKRSKKIKLRKNNSRRTITFTRHEQGGPTVRAREDWDVDNYLKELSKLLKMKPKNSDDKIADLLIRLTTNQRHQLERLFDESNQKKPLRSYFHDKKRKSKAGFNKTMQLLLAADTERDALCINQALKRRNYELIVEILVTRHSIHIRHIREVYAKLFEKELNQMIKNTFKEKEGLCLFLLGLLNNTREINNVVDLDPINRDLAYLRNCTTEHNWTDFEQIRHTTDLISKRSFGHLWYLLKKGFEKDEFAKWCGMILGWV